MDRNGNLRSRTAAALDQGDGDTERLATEWAMPFIPEDGSNSPTDVPFTTPRRPQRPVSGCVVFFGRLLMLFGIVVLLGGVLAGFNMMTREAHRTAAPIVKQVSGVPTVQIENSIGTVDVIVGRSDEVKVIADVDVKHISQGLADEAANSYNVEVDDTSEPGTIKIRASERAPFTGEDFFDGWLAHRSIRLTVSIPANSNLKFDMSAGLMTAEGISGRVNAVMHEGALNLVNMNLADGSSFDVKRGVLFFNGALQTDASLNVQVKYGYAELELPKLTDAFLDAHADAGNVSATGWTGPISRMWNDDNTAISGYLTSNETTKSRITVSVYAGHAEIIGASDRAFDQPPAQPAVPAVPERPERPTLPGR